MNTESKWFSTTKAGAVVALDVQIAGHGDRYGVGVVTTRYVATSLGEAVPPTAVAEAMQGEDRLSGFDRQPRAWRQTEHSGVQTSTFPEWDL